MRAHAPAAARPFIRPIAALATALLIGASPAAAVGTPAAAARPTSGRIMVKFNPGVSERTKAAARAAVAATKVAAIPQLGVDVLRVPAPASATALARLQRHAAIAYAEPDGIVQVASTTPNDPYYGRQWSPAKTRATAAWDLTTGSASTVIAVLDTGVSSTHIELAGKLVPGRNVIGANANTEDDHGHGTQSAGVIGAVTNNATGVASYCWKCSIMPVKVMASNGLGTMSDLAAGITWATDHGAKVISMSLSGPAGTSTLAGAVKYASDRGVVLAAAAGNDGTTAPRYPAAYSDVIGVAGSDTTDLLYTWSNSGSWVDVSAPGVNMTTNYTGGYANYAGTSSATPVVAAIAGLALSYDPEATAEQVRDALKSTAVPVPGVAFGRVDALATVQAMDSGQAAPSPEPTAPPSPEPTATPTPQPEPTAAPAPVTTTTEFSGMLNGKTLVRSHEVTTGAGQQVATLNTSKSVSAALTLYDSSGAAVASGAGGSSVTVSVETGAGTYTYEAQSSTKSTYTLSVTHTTP